MFLTPSYYPKTILDKIRAISPPIIYDSIEDSYIWGGIESGIFSISSMYSYLSHNSDDAPSLHWDIMWKLQVPERIKSFVWKVFHNGILTDMYLNRLQLRNKVCDVCVDHLETILDALRDCLVANGVIWSVMITSSGSSLLI